MMPFSATFQYVAAHESATGTPIIMTQHVDISADGTVRPITAAVAHPQAGNAAAARAPAANAPAGGAQGARGANLAIISLAATAPSAERPPAGAPQVLWDIHPDSLGWTDFAVAPVRLPGEGGQRAAVPNPNPRTDLLRRQPRPPRSTSALGKGLECLIELCSLARVPKAAELTRSDQVDLTPGTELLRDLVVVYLAKWQKLQPVIHVGTFEFTECPMTLVFAMACMGAALSDDETTVSQSYRISSLADFDLNLAVSRMISLSRRSIFPTRSICVSTQSISPSRRSIFPTRWLTHKADPDPPGGAKPHVPCRRLHLPDIPAGRV